MKKKTGRKMTKRQVLNALLETKEKKDKLYESQKRIWAREEKLDAEHIELANKLSLIDYDERSKKGGGALIPKQPIIFKGCLFDVSERTNWKDAGCEIMKVSSVS